jgi:hypothetical protein
MNSPSHNNHDPFDFDPEFHRAIQSTPPPLPEQQDSDGLVARLKLHSTWRDSHGELNDAPNEAATTIEAMSRQLTDLRLELVAADGQAHEMSRQLAKKDEALRVADDAIADALDDMRDGGLCICEQAKDQLIAAWALLSTLRSKALEGSADDK